MKIARVFVRKTNMTPRDSDCYYGLPEMYMPKYDQINISVTFTWDKKKAEDLKYQWEPICKNIKIGGPAYGESKDQFIPGMYLKKGITITSRGCNNNCGWCLVKNKLKEHKIYPGNIIQDNNFLQCSKNHRSETYDMLKDQNHISFQGGLELNRLTDFDIEQLRNLRIKELWVACDHKNQLSSFKKNIKKLTKYFKRYKIRCYVLIGDNIQENKNRLKEVYLSGCLPFAQLYQPADKFIEYSKKWRDFARRWSRPAIYKSINK
jgi:hypothetical protein